jgi:hypothetical protein
MCAGQCGFTSSPRSASYKLGRMLIVRAVLGATPKRQSQPERARNMMKRGSERTREHTVAGGLPWFQREVLTPWWEVIRKLLKRYLNSQ